jgi:hypothetical protein
MTDEQKRSELLNKLHSRMNQSKVTRLNKSQKEQKMNEMKEKLIGDNKEMAQVFDTVLKKTKKKAKNKKKSNNLISQDSLQKDLENNLSSLNFKEN